ncbi:MAG: hypothetical protein H2056_04465 [Sphingopyxis sp.]|nr:hypothetical protein [Sphingopyxis sp.]
MTAVGYSGTPLAKKLGLKAGLTLWPHALPGSVAAEVADAGHTLLTKPVAGMDCAHIFVTEAAQMRALLTDLRHIIAADGFVWVSWPKKASKQPTDITEDVIRAVALPMGWVDIKVCAVDAVWSGLKLAIRKELR